MKVFLGGTCRGYNWREDLIKNLKCEYFNPLLKEGEEWTKEHEIKENIEKENADYNLYVITNDMIGVYSIAEVVDDSNKKPKRTIFCYIKEGFDKSQIKLLNATSNIIKNNGAYVFENLNEVANFLNRS